MLLSSDYSRDIRHCLANLSVPPLFGESLRLRFSSRLFSSLLVTCTSRLDSHTLYPIQSSLPPFDRTDRTLSQRMDFILLLHIVLTHPYQQGCVHALALSSPSADLL